MTKMRWHQLKWRGKPTTNIRTEAEMQDRADRWLSAVEHRRQQRRTTAMAPSSTISIQRRSTR
jgi:hypothetical protein